VPDVTITRRGSDRLRGGHPWIYRSDVVRADARPGDIVRVRSERKRPLGWALWSDTSQIAIRMIDPAGTAEFDEQAWLRERLDAAVAYRATLGIGDDAYRLVHAEADRLPGLIVDRYGDYLVVQTLCQGVDRRLDLIVALLVEIVAPRGVLTRNDPKVRQLEGLAQTVEVVHGDVPERVSVREGAVTRSVDLRHGQKTGLFLDQRENYRTAAGYARGRALDAFAYQGGFALHLAGRADTVLALDSSEPAVAATRAAAAANGLANVEAREVNVFDALRELEVDEERFDTIVLDPPAFARSRAAVERAAAAYKEINLRALKLLAPGGHLATFSCSYHVDAALFEAIVADAAADARAAVALIERRLQARDHPVLMGVPESSYLKGLVLRKLA
jgi:23S rRNA (cytosine1962-C5)-methyltransferase